MMLVTNSCIGTHHLFCVEVTSPGLYMYIQGLQSMIPIPLHSGAGAVGTGGSAGGPKPSGIQPRRPLEQVTCFKVRYNIVHITTLCKSMYSPRLLPTWHRMILGVRLHTLCNRKTGRSLRCGYVLHLYINAF